MDFLALLEQSRFAVELIGAALLLTLPTFKKKEHFPARLSAACAAAFLAVLLCLLLGSRWSGIFSLRLSWLLYMGWTLLLLLLTSMILSAALEMSVTERIIILTDAYALRQICDVVINEILTDLLWTKITPRTVLAYLIFCALLILPAYALFAYVQVPAMRAAISYGIRDDAGNRRLHLILQAALLILSFGNAYLLLYTEDHVHLMVCVINLIVCFLILTIQNAVIAISAMTHDQQILDALMKERQKQYELSSEVVTSLNHKCHDLKNQLLALKEMDQAQKNDWFREAGDLISDYEISAHTSNDVLNVLLVEKMSYCRKHEIDFTYMADAAGLSFMDTMELYTLLGNAIDNAIECVLQYEDPDRRLISMNILQKQGLICIQVENCFDGVLVLHEGLPVSTKNDDLNHGFGTRSMQLFARRYGGELSFSAGGGIFTLNIVIPLPDAERAAVRKK